MCHRQNIFFRVLLQFKMLFDLYIDWQAKAPIAITCVWCVVTSYVKVAATLSIIHNLILKSYTIADTLAFEIQNEMMCDAIDKFQNMPERWYSYVCQMFGPICRKFWSLRLNRII